MSDYRKGSLGEAEQKGLKKAKIVMGLATVLLFAMSYFNLFHTNLYMWQHRADGSARLIGGLLYGLCLVPLLFESWISNYVKNETLWYVIWILLLLASLGVSCGFNFSL